jgi:hypothetical protein
VALGRATFINSVVSVVHEMRMNSLPVMMVMVMVMVVMTVIIMVITVKKEITMTMVES